MKKRRGVNLDDIAEAITDLGTMVAEQIESLRNELRTEFRTEIGGLRSELHEHSRRIGSLEDRVGGVEGEVRAINNDLKELYSLALNDKR